MIKQSSTQRKLVMILADLARGGVGKTRVHLANEFIHHGVSVDLLLARKSSPYLDLIDPAVRVLDMPTSHALFGVPWLAWFLRRERPDVLLTQRSRINTLALRARKLAGMNTPVYTTINTNLTAQLKSLPPSKAHSQLTQMRRYFPRNNGIIAVSIGVANDAENLLAIDQNSLEVIYDPVVTTSIFEQAKNLPEHPWINIDSNPAPLLAIGRLEPQKDFSTLINAYHQLKASGCQNRLIILGEGKLRSQLEAQIMKMELTEQVSLPGFVANPYSYIARSSMLIMSSAWEGLGDVLVEALALGTPVVSTDCPSGPSEILDGGRYGRLVPVGDATALANAIMATLNSPLPSETLKLAAERFRLENVAKSYLHALHLD